MSRTALDILSEELLWAQDQILYTAITELTDNLDSFPMFGFGIAFMKRSAEKVLISRVKDKFVPEMEQHIAVNIAFIEELAAADDPAAVESAYEEKLLAADPLWPILELESEERKTVRKEILQNKYGVARQAASWVRTRDKEYASLIDLVEQQEKTVDEVMDELQAVFFYIDMMAEHRDQIDASRYSSLLDNPRIHDWFLTHLLTGLQNGRDQVLETFRTRLEEQKKITKDWNVLDQDAVDRQPT